MDFIMYKQVPYRGRFAPSPSGSLHFGSLIAALGSYLQAKSQHGSWQVRIDDIDPPREISGAADDILQTLVAYGLHWDGEVIYQSKNYDNYEEILYRLASQHLSYACECTRKIIKEQGGIYSGTCRNKQLAVNGHAIRINLQKLNAPLSEFNDRLQGVISLDSPHANEDFIIRRKDGLYAYNLAVVIDDIEQGITEVVRGVDLLPTTGKQLALYHLLNKKPPSYLHLPVAVTSPGEKLSKQNHALAINKNNPIPTLLSALAFLGHPVPESLHAKGCQKILDWAIKNWSIKRIPQQQEIQIEN
jgi:glutamyl-Q tRNA(Asp) synthetase